MVRRGWIGSKNEDSLYGKIRPKSTGFNLRIFIDLIPWHRGSPNFWRLIDGPFAFETTMAGGAREWRQNYGLGIFMFYTLLASFRKRNFCSLGLTISSFFDFSEDFKKIANFGHFRKIFGSYSVNEAFFEAPACHYLQLTTQDNISWLPENVQKDHFWLNLPIFIKKS